MQTSGSVGVAYFVPKVKAVFGGCLLGQNNLLAALIAWLLFNSRLIFLRKLFTGPTQSVPSLSIASPLAFSKSDYSEVTRLDPIHGRKPF